MMQHNFMISEPASFLDTLLLIIAEFRERFEVFGAMPRLRQAVRRAIRA